jgi:type I restriction enzyme M protein
MVDATDPKIGEKVVDPFCGTGGFLIYAFDVISEKIRNQDFAEEEKERWKKELSNKSLYGTDWKERTSQACKMNMLVHGDGSAGIFMHDGLTDVEGDIEPGKFDICLTNPPFGSSESDNVILNQYELGSGRNSQSREILSIERSLELVKPGGEVAIVIIDGILNNDSNQYVRDYIKRNAWIKGIVSLNPETFEGYGARAKTSILFLERKEEPDSGEQDETFMAIAENTGYAPNGDRVPGNDLPDILLAYQKFLDDKGEDEFPDDTSAWIESVEDRLDVEYYDRTDHEPESVDVEEIKEGFGSSLEAIKEEYENLIQEIESVFVDVEYQEYKLDDVLVEKSNREKVNEDELYTLLGVRWWGGGAFKREEEYGRDMGTKTKYRVKSPWIMYNKLFAHKGSFAVLNEEHDDCHVSVEFPTFDVKEDFKNRELIRKYIVRCMNTPQYQDWIDAQTTGSTKTSRSRFHPDDFLEMSIKIPESRETLSDLVTLLDRATTLKFEQENLEEEADKLLDSVGRMLPGPSSTPEIDKLNNDQSEKDEISNKRGKDDQSNLDSF